MWTRDLKGIRTKLINVETLSPTEIFSLEKMEKKMLRRFTFGGSILGNKLTLVNLRGNHAEHVSTSTVSSVEAGIS